MRETPSYYLLVWRSARTDHVWTETHADLDEACMAFHEATAIPDPSRLPAPHLIAAATLVMAPTGLRCELIDMVEATEMWRRDHAEEEQGRLDITAEYRGDLF